MVVALWVTARRFDGGDEVVDFGFATVELDDEVGFGVEVVAGMDEGFGGLGGEAVHHFHAARDDAGGDDGGHAFGGVGGGGKAHEEGAGAGGLGQDTDGDLGDDAEEAFGAHE